MDDFFKYCSRETFMHLSSVETVLRISWSFWQITFAFSIQFHSISVDKRKENKLMIPKTI